MTQEKIKQSLIDNLQYDFDNETFTDDLKCLFDEVCAAAVDIHKAETASLRKELEEAEKQRKGWHDQWFKIVDAIVPKAKCRDCADENGICPTTKVPCDSTEAVIFMFNEERAKSAKLVEPLEEAIAQIEYMQNKFAKTGSGKSVLLRCKRILAEYEGKGGVHEQV